MKTKQIAKYRRLIKEMSKAIKTAPASLKPVFKKDLSDYQERIKRLKAGEK